LSTDSSPDFTPEPPFLASTRGAMLIRNAKATAAIKSALLRITAITSRLRLSPPVVMPLKREG